MKQMKQISKLISSLLISVCIVFTMLPTVAFALDANSLETIIESYSGGSGSLSASVSGDIVTVTGTITNATSELSLNISAGVTVKWEASITAGSDYEGNIIALDGRGVFEVLGGTISGNKCKSISITYSGVDLYVTGGTVSSTSGDAVYTTTQAGGTIIVSGGMVSTETGTAINTSSVIGSSYEPSIVIREDGKVKATVLGGSAINAGSNSVKVEDNAEVSAISGIAIKSSGSKEVIISGGTVISGLNNAIYADGITTITVSGGTVSNSQGASTGSTIRMTAIGGGTVNISGTGKVLAQGTSGYAIQTNGGDVTVTGGLVRATGGDAIKASSVAISGGTVFAYGDTIKGERQVIYMPDHEADFTAPTSDGVVIAWNKDAGNSEYDPGSNSDLIILPDTATAQWVKQGDESGISYINGENTGFIEIEGVTVFSITNGAELKTALEATTAKNVNIDSDITIADNITVGADHTLNIADGCTLFTGEDSTLTIPVDKTLALTGTGTFKVDSKTVENGVDVKGNLTGNGIHIIVANSNLNGIKLESGAQMQVQGGKLDMENTGAFGIFGDGTLSVDENCQVTIKNSSPGGGANNVAVNASFTVKNSTVQIQTTELCTGIQLYSDMNLAMENSVINVKNTEEYSSGLVLWDNVNINADTNSKLILAEGVTLSGFANKLSDQGIILTKSGDVTVGAQDAIPSADGLTAGMYTWNGSVFAKAKSSTTENNTSQSSNQTVVSYVPYVPTVPEEISRYSYKGRETVEFSAVSNPSKVALTMNNSIQGKLFFDSIAYVLGDNKIGRTYNIFANQKTEPTDQPVSITLTIPEGLRKEGRTFKMIGVMKNGMPYVLEDMDVDDKTITILTNHFYGFALVYSDK